MSPYGAHDASMSVPPHRHRYPPPGDSPTSSRRERLRRIAPAAGRQDGLVTRRQLTDAGWTPDQVAHEIAFDRWRAVTPLVVAMQTGGLSSAQMLWLGVLHAGNGAALTHITAAIDAGLRWKAPDDRIHVITEKGDLVAPVAGFVFHQTRRPFSYWLEPDSSPSRLRIEHACLLAAERDRSVRRAIGLMAAAVQQRLTTVERLEAASIQIRKLRHGTLLRLSLADIAGGAQSFAEIDVGRLCREAGLLSPTRQRIRVDKAGRRRFLDCEWLLPDGRVVVLEVDGSFHLETEHWWRDMKRERSVVVGGSQVLRCSSVELRLEPSDILDDLRRVGVPPRSSAA